MSKLAIICPQDKAMLAAAETVSYTHLRAHETD